MKDSIKNDSFHHHGQSPQDWWICSHHEFIWQCGNKNLRKLSYYPPNAKSLLKNYCKTILAKVPLKRCERWRNSPPLLKPRKYLLKKYYRIMFVRHPWKRLVSVYLDKFCTGNYPLSEKAKYATKYIYDKYGLDHEIRDDYKSGGGITFSQFLDYIDSHPDEMLNSHWKPQYLSMEGLSFDSIIKIENIRNDINSVIKKLGIKDDLPLLKLSNIIYKKLKGDYSSYYPHDLIKIKNEYGYFPSYKNFYKENLISLVGERYKKDIELFNYKYDD